jgi:3-oxoacyl-[acyl-carrier protein] reductase
VRLDGRAAVVTGAAQGLGEAIARGLHRVGASIVCADVNEEGVRGVAGSLGERAVAAACDVRLKADVVRAAEAAVASFGRLDVMVNNAARTVSRPLFEIEADEWDDVLAVNLRGVLFGCQVAGERMRAQGSGRIVNLASLAGQQGGTVAGAHLRRRRLESSS